MKKFRWQLIIIFLTGLVVGILLLTEQPAGTSQVAPEPVSGGIYTEALVGSMQRLNPLLDTYNAADRDVDRLIFSGLVRFDGRGNPQPDLAESWGVSQNGKIYTFTLKPNATWHDGKPVTAEDVVFTIDMITKGGDFVPADLQSFWKDIEVKALNENTLQFRLPEPFAPFVDYLTFGVLPKHVLGTWDFKGMVDAPFNLAPVGSGPFRFEQLLTENGQISGVVLKAYDGYYDQRAYLDEIVFRYYPTSADALAAYQNQQVQGISEITADTLSAALKEPALSIYTGRKPELAMILFNTKEAKATFLKEKDVRRALLMGLNRQHLVDSLLAGQAVVADGPILPDTWAYYGDVEKYSFDPEAARSLLKNAGYVVASETEAVRKKDDLALSFTLLYPDDDLHKSLAEAIQSDWKALNVDVQLEAVPYDQLVNDRLDQRNYQAALVDMNLSRSPDPDPYPFWDQAQATGGQNYTQWDNRMASEFLEQARVTVSQDERVRFYRNFQLLFSQDVPAITLYYPVYNYGVDRQVQGVSMGPLFDSSDRFATVTRWFMVSRRGASSSAGVTPTAAP